MNPSSANDRSAHRFSASIPAFVYIDGVGHRCQAENLSRTGVLLVGDVPAPAEPGVMLTLTSPSGDLQLSTAVRVVHREKDSAGEGYRLGVEFIEIEGLHGNVAVTISPAHGGIIFGLFQFVLTQEVDGCVGGDL